MTVQLGSSPGKLNPLVSGPRRGGRRRSRGNETPMMTSATTPTERRVAAKESAAQRRVDARKRAAKKSREEARVARKRKRSKSPTRKVTKEEVAQSRQNAQELMEEQIQKLIEGRHAKNREVAINMLAEGTTVSKNGTLREMSLAKRLEARGIR